MDFDLRSVRKYFEFVKSTRNAQLLSEAVAEDLELDLLFLHTDRTTSKIGQQYLYSYFRLLNFGDSENKFPTEIFKKDARLCSLAKQELKKISEPSDYQIIDLIRDDLFANENYYRYAQFALPAIILIMVCAFFVPKTVLLLLPFFAVNAYFHYSNKNYVDYNNLRKDHQFSPDSRPCAKSVSGARE